MDGGEKQEILVNLAGLPVNIRESDDPKISAQYMPFYQLMEKITSARKKADLSEEEGNLTLSSPSSGEESNEESNEESKKFCNKSGSCSK